MEVDKEWWEWQPEVRDKDFCDPSQGEGTWDEGGIEALGNWMRGQGEGGVKDDSKPLTEQPGPRNARRQENSGRRGDTEPASFLGDVGWAVLNPREGSVSGEKSSTPQGTSVGRGKSERNFWLRGGGYVP